MQGLPDALTPNSRGSRIAREPAFSERFHAQMDERADIADACFQDIGDFFIAESSFKLEAHGFALFIWKLDHPLLDLASHLILFHRGGWTGRGGGFEIENFLFHRDEA